MKTYVYLYVAQFFSEWEILQTHELDRKWKHNIFYPKIVLFMR
jgi:hypothetical protein